MASESVKVGDQIVFLTNPLEVQFLRAYRSADSASKRDCEKLLRAGVAGLLPSVGTVEAMTAAERRAFIDSLPEVQEALQ